MIWFACRQCGKKHGRPESAVGATIFCDCGQANVVPWESTIDAPEKPAVPVPPPLPELRPIPLEDEAPPAGRSRPPQPPQPPPITLGGQPVVPIPLHPDDDPARQPPQPRRRAAERLKPDPHFCLNHEERPSRHKCADCGEAFCDDCVVVLRETILCGPCKNFRMRLEQRPPELSGKALFSLFLGLVSTPLAFVLFSLTTPLIGLVSLLPQGLALLLGVRSLRDTDQNPRKSGRALAVSSVLAAGLALAMTGVLWWVA
jgi:hypothetical protein